MNMPYKTPYPKSLQAGFTMVELLITLAISIFIFLLVAQFITTNASFTDRVNRSAMGQQELNTAEQIIGSRVREASYIFPSGVTIKLPAGAKNLNLSNSTQTVIGTLTNPMLAMALPPKLPGSTCTPAVAGGTGTDGCMRFYAYYPMLRSKWVAATNTSPLDADFPGLNPKNDNNWVLLEYRAFYATPPAFDAHSTAAAACADSSVYGSATSSDACLDTQAAPMLTAGADVSTLTSGVARLVADNLVPLTTSTAPLFTLNTRKSPINNAQLDQPGYAYMDSTYTLYVPPYVGSVGIQLAAQNNPGGRVPQTGTYSLVATPSNLGKLFCTPAQPLCATN